MVFNGIVRTYFYLESGSKVWIMQTTNANQESRSNDFRWYLLGDYSISGLLPDTEKDDQRTVELPSNMMRELDMPLERIEPVEMALRSFASKALRRTQPDGGVHPRQIRIYCHRKIIDEEMKGGWGYFVIERPKEASPQDDDEETHDVIDFYIYEEG